MSLKPENIPHPIGSDDDVGWGASPPLAVAIYQDQSTHFIGGSGNARTTSPALTVAIPQIKASGAGLILYQSFEEMGRFVGNTINTLYNKRGGPKKVAKLLVDHFADGIARETALDRCTMDEKAKKVVQVHCLNLLSYANAKSNSPETQLVTFKIIFTLVTRYPGIRPFFTKKKSSKTTFIDSWTRAQPDECDTNWKFYHELAKYSLGQSELSELIESEIPSKFSQLTPLTNEGSLTKERVEQLLSFCSSDVKYDNEKICAIRYLAAVLELPTFWIIPNPDTMGMTKRLFGFLSDLCNKIFRMLEDTIPDPTENDQTTDQMHVRREAVDNLVYTTFEGLLSLHTSNPSIPTLPSTLLDSVDFIKRYGDPNPFPRAYGSLPKFEDIVKPLFFKESEGEDLGDTESFQLNPSMESDHRREAEGHSDSPENFADLVATSKNEGHPQDPPEGLPSADKDLGDLEDVESEVLVKELSEDVVLPDKVEPSVNLRFRNLVLLRNIDDPEWQ